MPRATDGTYSLPSGTIVNTGDTILVSQHNPAMQDIAQALSNSLDRNGYGGMRAPLNMGGFPVTNAADGAADTDLATVGQIQGLGIPIGGVIDFAGSAAPTGFLLCFGQAISRTTYAALFAVIGTAYGAGDGSTTFNVPDARGRVAAGKDDMGGTNAARLGSIPSTTLGGSGGSQTHTLTIGQMPAHDHSGTTNINGEHAHSLPLNARFGLAGGGTQTAVEPGAGYSTGGAGAHSHSIPAQGSGEAHNNVQPTLIFNKIIKAEIV